MVKDRGAWSAAVHGLSKSRLWLRAWTTTTIFINFPFGAAFAVSHSFCILCSISICFRIIFISFLASLFRSMLSAFRICEFSSFLFLISIFLLISTLWLEKTSDMISDFLNMLRRVLWLNIWSILENSLCTWKECVILLLLDEMLYLCLLVPFHLSVVQVQCFFIDFLFGPSTHCWSEIFKFPSITLLLSIYPSGLLIFVLYIQVVQCWLHIHLQLFYPGNELTPFSLYSDLLCLLW